MTKNLLRKKRFRKAIIVLAALFVVLFSLRLLYGYLYSDLKPGNSNSSESFSDFGDVKKNYASEKYESKKEPDPSGESIPNDAVSDAKYEKTATLKTKTSDFESDEKKIRTQITNFKGIIQYEKKSGNKGNREIKLLIGVAPEKFDSLYTSLLKIGQIRFNEVVKVDKTNDYRRLMAEKESFEKILKSLNELKSKSGTITDYIGLHDKILEIENNMQDIGVRLGDFKSEEQFCTIKLSILEGVQNKISNTFWIRFKIAFEWTLIYYCLFVCSLAGILIAAWFLALVTEKIVSIKGKTSEGPK